MVTLRQRINQLKFALKYAYHVPEGELDKIDIEAYADPELEFGENMKILLERYPELDKYIFGEWGESKDWDTYAEQEEAEFMEYLWNLLESLSSPEFKEWAYEEIKKAGLEPDEAVRIIRNYLEEQSKRIVVVQQKAKSKREVCQEKGGVWIKKKRECAYPVKGTEFYLGERSGQMYDSSGKILTETITYKNVQVGDVVVDRQGWELCITGINEQGIPATWIVSTESITKPEGIKQDYVFMVLIKNYKKLIGKKCAKENKSVDVMDKIVQYTKKVLEERGYRDGALQRELDNLRIDIEGLVSAVKEGRMSLEEAYNRIDVIAPPPIVEESIGVEERKGRVIKAEEISGGEEYPSTIPSSVAKILDEEMVNMPPRVKNEFIQFVKPNVLRDIILFGFDYAKQHNKIEVRYGDEHFIKVLLSTLFSEVGKKFSTQGSLSDYGANQLLRLYNGAIMARGIGNAFQHIWRDLYYRLPPNRAHIPMINNPEQEYPQSQIVYALILHKVLNAFGLEIPKSMEVEHYILDRMGVK